MNQASKENQANHPEDALVKDMETQYKELPVIENADRLVPDGFEIKVTQEDVDALFHAGETYPGYPSEENLVQWDDATIDAWEEAGFPDEWLDSKNTGKHYEPHPNYLGGLKHKARDPERFGWILEDDGEVDLTEKKFADSFEGKHPRTKRGIPIHPNYRMLLKRGVAAQNGWSGFYWGAGAQKAGDPILLGEQKGVREGVPVRKLKFAGIEAKALKDNGNKKIVGLPGGMVDPKEPAMTAGIREISEEAGVDAKYFKEAEVIAKVAVVEGRTGLTQWPESTVTLAILPPEEVEKITLRAGDDAANAQWLDASQANFDEKFFSPTHAKMVKLAVLKWQEKNPGLVVDKDGVIGRRAE